LGVGSSSCVTEYPTPLSINSNGNIKKIAAGDSFSMILKNDGTLYAFGRNQLGQLGSSGGVGSSVPLLIPSPFNSRVIDFDCGNDFTIFLRSNGKVYLFGENAVFKFF
jgi:alpha-tubulin suppressor-like RCC1 family protein